MAPRFPLTKIARPALGLLLVLGVGTITLPLHDALAETGSDNGIAVPLFTPASATGSRILMRVINHSDVGGTVTIRATDDDGMEYGPASLAIGAGEAIHFDGQDLENGNPAKGLSGGTGPGSGAWRLELSSDLEIEAFAYARTPDGLVTGMHDVVPRTGGAYRVAMFQASGNARQESRLRLSNTGPEAANVTIAGVDDDGGSPGGVVWFSLPAGASRTLTARDLELGTAEGLSGALGDGAGRWRLTVNSSQPLLVLNLLASPATGRLTNVSSAPRNVTDGDDGATALHTVPLLPAASRQDLGGLVRVINRSGLAGSVRIYAFDDSGKRYGPVDLRLGPREAQHFTGRDLETGGDANALSTGTGAGAGDWRLQLASTLELEVLAYVHTLNSNDGLLTNVHSVVPRVGGAHRVTIFDPDRPPGDAVDAESAPGQVSRLRLINAGVEAADFTIVGVDGDGVSPGIPVRLTLPAGASRTVTIPDLETGDADGLSGALGDGAGRWHLTVTSNQPATVLSLLSGPSDDLANLSAAPSGPAGAGSDVAADETGSETADDLFSTHISAPIVQSLCVLCHVEGGVSGNTRLVFERGSDAEQGAHNFQAFEFFVAEVANGANLILAKVQGVSHGGGLQVAAGSPNFANLERFLLRLDPSDTVLSAPAITPQTLFDPVRMAPLRKTLRRAALLFAGRLPTEAEIAAAHGGGEALRATIRDLMTGPAFHAFLVEGANDRLLTNRQGRIIDPNVAQLVEFTDESYRRKAAARSGGNMRPYFDWHDRVQHGFRRAPVELVAHVVANDLPYTEILTADYIMANPWSAAAYGASTTFRDAGDVHEFKPARIAEYYLKGDDFESEFDSLLMETHVTDRGSRRIAYPHAGLLNTHAFLFRYPSTATNRNRARSRWTYYHFLGLDIEKSASRTTDPVALADTNNPTLHNPACTVCHTVMDPVAGAFQNYGDEGLYRDQWGGDDSLDRFYKETGGEAFSIEGSSWPARQTLTWSVALRAGVQTLGIVYPNHFYIEETDTGGRVFLDQLILRDAGGDVVTRREFEQLPIPDAHWGRCGQVEYNRATRRRDHVQLWGGHRDCAFYVDVEVETAGLHRVEIVAWSGPQHPEYGDGGYAQLAVTADPYRDGDTWYRDMLTPGFAGELAPDPDNSLQWLARKIIADQRFAEATVRFWWPAVMGSEMAEPPADDGDADFQGKLLAANSQAAERQRLADGFRRGFGGRSPYNLKDLLVELVLSDWLRADRLDDPDPVRRVALDAAGGRRLLTPEELRRKTTALTGVEWGRHTNTACWGDCDPEPSKLTREFRLLYGGIDSDGITERARDITSVMAGVAKRHAVQVSCPVVLRELFLLPESERRLFSGLDLTEAPDRADLAITHLVRTDSWHSLETFALQGSLSPGPKTVRLTYLNGYSGRHIRLLELHVRSAAGQTIFHLQLNDLEAVSECNRPVSDNHFALHCAGSLEIPIEVPESGTYAVEVVGLADHAGDELPALRMEVLDPNGRNRGANAVRQTLADLHETLLGVRTTPHSPDVEAAYRLFVDVRDRKRGLHDRFDPWDCDLHNDHRLFDGILDDVIVEKRNEYGTYLSYDWDRVHALFDEVDFSDPYHAAQTWVVVLAYLLTDYRYLYL